MQVYNARHHTLILLKDFLPFLQQGFPSNPQELSVDEQAFIEQLQALITALENNSAQANFEGQDWLTRLFRNFPNSAPSLGREVLWYFGGDALHFMPDEEIERFQQLEDAMQEGGEGFDFLAAKKAIFSK
ncbi:MAG: PA2817 family protein [Bermanella sp.]